MGEEIYPTYANTNQPARSLNLLPRLCGQSSPAVAEEGFIVIGMAQFIAIFDGFDLPSLFGALIVVALGYVPVAGAVAGAAGEIETWDWRWAATALLFLWPQVLGLVSIGFILALERAQQ